MRASNSKKKIVFILIAIAIVGVILMSLIDASSSVENVKITKSVGNDNTLVINLTYMNKEEGFDNTFTVVGTDSSLKAKDKSDVRVTTGFCDTSSLDNYIISNGYKTNTEFLVKNGYVSLYYQFGGKKYYLLQNIVTKPYCWNLLIDNNGEYKFIKLSDINQEGSNNEYPHISFSKKVEYVEGKIRFYLDNGIYTFDLEDNMEVNSIDLNKMFYNITKAIDMKLYASKIEYYDGRFYVLAKDSNNIYHVISYNEIEKKVETFPLSYKAQDITIIDGKITIISISKNNVYLEFLSKDSNHIFVKELSDINKFNPCMFQEDLFCSTIMYDDKLSITLSGDIKTGNKKTYVFSIATKTLELINYREYDMYNNDFMLYGLHMYIK